MKLHHEYAVSFSLVTDHDRDHVTAAELLNALKNLVVYFEAHPEAITNSCEYTYNTYEVKNQEPKQ